MPAIACEVWSSCLHKFGHCRVMAGSLENGWAPFFGGAFARPKSQDPLWSDLRLGGKPPPQAMALSPQLFSICSMSSSPSREQRLFVQAPGSRQAMAGSPLLQQSSSGLQPSDSSQDRSSWQVNWSSKEWGTGSGTGVPAGVLPPGLEAESNAVQDLVLLTRAKGLWELWLSTPTFRQLRLLKV